MSTWLSLLPALVAIPLAFFTHRILLALGIYVFLGALIIEQGWLPDASARFVLLFWQVISDRDNLFIIVFSLLIGSLIGVIQRAGGVEGFNAWIDRRNLADTPRHVSLLTLATSMVLFVETYFGVLVAGLLGLSLFDRFKVPRLRLSYILDTTCSPKCMMIPINAWGAYIISMFVDEGVTEPVSLLIRSLPFIFYGWVSLLLVAFVATTGWEIPWKLPVSPSLAGEEPIHFSDLIESDPHAPKRARHLWGPIALLVSSVLILLLITGDAPLAIFTAVAVTLIATLVWYQKEGALSWQSAMKPLGQGIVMMWPLMRLLVFAFTVGATTRVLGTGEYMASALQGEIAAFWLPFLVFGIGCLVSFATGTSWGTFAIMIPIVIPLAEAFQISPALLVGAALSGGLFGDHSSPVSDSTMVAALAAGVEPIDHIRHQLPYALLGAGISLLLYLLVGMF
ncbi:MAG: hypothetical protein AXA67_11240 [Methylothermaceae bacteria B42]|nr:MAG: hypothetical protein AXA67_11240 [Methylothermaceae bacteria B42]HHJ39106.1 hypothetical protein [Methylothermaceae bacterium]